LRKRLIPSSKKDLATSALATTFNPKETLPGSSDGPNTSPSKDKKESSYPESKFLQQLPNSQELWIKTKVSTS
jgi:hypothetical protein